MPRLFDEEMQDISPDRNVDGGTMTDTHAGTFAREVLMSYRLIFGQNKRSWKAYRTLKVHLHATTGMELDDHDPLLDRLCGQPWQKERRFYADVESLDACFLPSDCLPFLGPRLLRLQQFSRSQTPTSWTVLWYDRRNLCKAPQTLSSEYYRSDRNSAILHVLGIYSHRSRNYLDRYFSDCFCHLGRRGGVQTDNAEPQLILLRSCWSKIVLNASNQSIGQGNQLRLGIRLLITTILAGLGALLTPILQNSSCRGGRPTKASACQQHAPRRSSGLIANKRLPLLFM